MKNKMSKKNKQQKVPLQKLGSEKNCSVLIQI